VQQDVFAEHGAELGRVLIGHQDEQEDVAPIRKLAERGTFVGVDRIGLELIAPDVRRADHVATLVREGFTNQVCLSQDHICVTTAPRPAYWVPPEHREAAAARRAEIDWQVSDRPYTYVMTDFVPMLRDRGVTDADVETIFVDNPRRLLTGS
jgi:phosphotriesterase-related protein